MHNPLSQRVAEGSPSDARTEHEAAMLTASPRGAGMAEALSHRPALPAQTSPTPRLAHPPLSRQPRGVRCLLKPGLVSRFRSDMIIAFR